MHNDPSTTDSRKRVIFTCLYFVFQFMCADFLCNESDGDRCNDIEDLGGRVSVQSCEPQQEFCLVRSFDIA